jgi:hypothetical protein
MAFEGYKYTGEGFLFSKRGGNCETFKTMQDLVLGNPRNSERIRPLLRGEAFLKDPTQTPDRYIIDFEDFTEDRAREWTDLFRILEQRVKPFRSQSNQASARRLWWQFYRVSPALRAASKTKTRLLMRPKISSHHIFGFVPSDIFISAPHVVVVREENSILAILQSRIHEIWVSIFGAALKDDLCYTPSDCLENFPFPKNNSSGLEVAGQQYDEFRRQVTIILNIGLTEIYNKFHDPDEKTSDILCLRELHTAMDRAVLDAYGWSDIPIDCEFLLDYEIDEDEWGTKKKPWRCRWPDEVRDEVLARLLELNAERAREEARFGTAAPKKSSKKPATKPAPKALVTEDLFL